MSGAQTRSTRFAPMRRRRAGLLPKDSREALRRGIADSERNFGDALRTPDKHLLGACDPQALKILTRRDPGLRPKRTVEGRDAHGRFAGEIGQFQIIAQPVVHETDGAIDTDLGRTDRVQMALVNQPCIGQEKRDQTICGRVGIKRSVHVARIALCPDPVDKLSQNRVPKRGRMKLTEVENRPAAHTLGNVLENGRWYHSCPQSECPLGVVVAIDIRRREHEVALTDLAFKPPRAKIAGKRKGSAAGHALQIELGNSRVGKSATRTIKLHLLDAVASRQSPIPGFESQTARMFIIVQKLRHVS